MFNIQAANSYLSFVEVSPIHPRATCGRKGTLHRCWLLVVFCFLVVAYFLFMGSKPNFTNSRVYQLSEKLADEIWQYCKRLGLLF